MEPGSAGLQVRQVKLGLDKLQMHYIKYKNIVFVPILLQRQNKKMETHLYFVIVSEGIRKNLNILNYLNNINILIKEVLI